ncbi:transposase, partial [bacterium]|nr:transposase [bacterium]
MCSYKKRKGGGRKNSSDAYEGAAEITCLLDDNKMPGKICPECEENKLFEVEPRKTMRLVGNAPITAFKFIQQQTRCICGAFFRADVGDEYRDIYDGEKYSPSALAAIMIHKYMMGVTFGKLEKVQAMSGVPVPATTQMNKIKDMALPVIQAVLGILSNLVSNAGILIFDDNRIRILEKRLTKEGKETHNGHGTAIIAGSFDNQGNEIILFNLDVNKHAGEVICDILTDRERDSLPLLASDGLPAYS